MMKNIYGIGIAVSPDRLDFDLDGNKEKEFMVYNPNDFKVEYFFSSKNNDNLFEFIPDEIKIKPDSYKKIKIKLNEDMKIKNYDDIIYIRESSDNNIKTNIAIKVHINKKRYDGKEFFVLSLVILAGVLLYYRNRKGKV